MRQTKRILALLALLCAIFALLAAGYAVRRGLPRGFGRIPGVGEWLAPSRAIDRITVHHTASGPTVGRRPVDVALVATWHRSRGIGLGYRDSRACAYHFLILRDGTVQAGRPLARRSSGTKNLDDNGRTIAICLVGDFRPGRGGVRWSGMWPSSAQLRAVEGIALWAFERYGFDERSVRGHREVASSECPGANFNLDALRRRLRRARTSGREGTEPPMRQP